MGIRSDAEAGRKVNFKNASIYWLSFLIAVAMEPGLPQGLLVSWLASKTRMWAAAFRLSGAKKHSAVAYRKGRKVRNRITCLSPKATRFLFERLALFQTLKWGSFFASFAPFAVNVFLAECLVLSADGFLI